VRSELPGIEHPAVMTMRTLADSVALRERALASGRVIVIGTGFIGCEIAGSLAMRGEAVTLVGQEALPQIDRLGEDAAKRVAGWLRQLGVGLVCGTAVRAIHDGRIVELEDRSHLPGDCIVLGMGARPRGQVARTAGLAINGASVVVDESMRATHAVGEVLAVGDVACAYNTSAGRHLTVEHWGDALEQGALAGQALAGRDCAWASVPGFWSTIGAHTLKYAAWGDGYDESRMDAHPDGAFTVWYSRGGAAVGVLTHERDEDYQRGRELVRAGAAIP
jgi:3-phenylpropionate/trans-cinnamate dioxygenase ferredoxin reductase component